MTTLYLFGGWLRPYSVAYLGVNLEWIHQLCIGKCKERGSLCSSSTRRSKSLLWQKRRSWSRIKAGHEVLVMAWQLECQHLASDSVAKRTWLKKPVRPLKPKLPPNLHPVEGDAREDDDKDFDEDDQIDWASYPGNLFRDQIRQCHTSVKEV